MASAKITLIGFNNYYENLWDLLLVPSGIDKEELINNILMKGGEFEVLYSNPEFMKNMIGIWSKKWMHTMERWVKALSINYDPLENYDRKEEWFDIGNRKADTQRSENANGADSSISSGTGETINERSAFDASDYSPHDKSGSSSTGTNSSNSSTSATGQIEENEDTTNKRTGRAHGNIGVTTSQQMLQSEIEVAKWNLYDEITDLFLSELCIYTY